MLGGDRHVSLLSTPVNFPFQSIIYSGLQINPVYSPLHFVYGPLWLTVHSSQWYTLVHCSPQFTSLSPWSSLVHDALWSWVHSSPWSNSFYFSPLQFLVQFTVHYCPLQFMVQSNTQSTPFHSTVHSRLHFPPVQGTLRSMVHCGPWYTPVHGPVLSNKSVRCGALNFSVNCSPLKYTFNSPFLSRVWVHGLV